MRSLGNWIVLHQRKKSGPNAPSDGLFEGLDLSGARAARADAFWSRLPDSEFLLETCQRRLAIVPRDVFLAELHEAPFFDVSVHSGRDAYAFLLRFATGLESQVRGETDVFGQLKDAWSNFHARENERARELFPWFQRIFEDTKEIRSRFLQNTGGASYGSLARRLMIRENAFGRGPILLIGSGRMAKAVGPFLGGRLQIWGRTESAVHSLADELEFKRLRLHREGDFVESPVSVERIQPEDRDGLKRALQTCVAVVLAVPNGIEAQEEWIEVLGGRGEPAVVLHIGALDSEVQTGWRTLDRVFTLDALFEIQRGSTERRESEFSKALRACQERAMLRSMGGSLSIAHGWEDLAAFV
jgi:hypothetical protein